MMEPITTSRAARKLYRAHVKARTNSWGSFRAFVRAARGPYRPIAEYAIPHISRGY